MDLYTIDVNAGYLRDKVIDEYKSLIWSERFLAAGDVQLVLPASIEMASLLAPGTLLGMNSSQELMLLDTRNIKGKLLTVTGKTLEVFLNERYSGGFTTTASPAHVMGQVVQNMIDRQLPPDPGFPQDGTHIPNLIVGSTSDGGMDDVTETIQYGPTYDILLALGQKYQLDFHVYWVRNDAGTAFELHFQVRAPLDLTTDQTTNEVIRYTPKLDNFDKVEEILSEVDFKSVVLALAPQDLSIGPVDPLKVSKVPNGSTVFQPFKERIVELDCSNITEAEVNGRLSDPDTATDAEKQEALYDIMRARAVKKLKEYAKTNSVDGEVVTDSDPETQYVYYMDPNPNGRPTYRVGDLIEAQGNYGSITTGNISEHMRSFDSSGQRSFPTISTEPEPIVDPPQIAT